VSRSRTPTPEASKRRSRKVQRTFTAILSPFDETEPESFPTLDFTTFPYRVALANWPDEWRERWGHRANALEDQGLGWRAAETLAFLEIQDERRAELGTQAIPLTLPEVERN